MLGIFFDNFLCCVDSRDSCDVVPNSQNSSSRLIDSPIFLSLPQTTLPLSKSTRDHSYTPKKCALALCLHDPFLFWAAVVARLFEYRFPHRKGLILQYNDGWGEIAPLPGFSKETFEEAKEEIFSLLSDLPLAKPKYPSVQFGIACAMRPLKAIKVPLCALDSPKPGCSTLKLKVGHLSIEEAVSLVKNYVGHYRLRIDCNRRWSLTQALAFAAYFSPTDFEYFEEPVQTLEELFNFSKMTQFPIALDETFREEGLIKIPTLKAVVIKPTLSGKLPAFSNLVLSSSYETSLGLLHIAHLATPNSPPLGLDTISDDLLSPPLCIENGHLIWKPSKNPIRTDLLCAL